MEKHGFVPGPDRLFEGLAEVVSYLRERQQEFRKDLPAWNHKVDALELLKVAPRPVILRYLDRIENDWIPDKKFCPATRLLQDLLPLPVVCLDEPLLKRVRGILELVHEMSELSHRQRVPVTPATSLFTRLERRAPGIQSYAHANRGGLLSRWA